MFQHLSCYLCLAVMASTSTAFAPLHSPPSSTALFGFGDTVKQWNFLAPWTDRWDFRCIALFLIWVCSVSNQIYLRPYKGPECVVEIIGADLNEKSNSNFDRFSKPDISVEVCHNKRTRKTQTEGNSFTPRYLWSAKVSVHYMSKCLQNENHASFDWTFYYSTRNSDTFIVLHTQFSDALPI